VTATRTLAALLGAALLACGGSKPPPKAASKAADKAAAPAAAAAAAAKPAEPEWVYSSAGKRDPFRSFISDFIRDEKEQKSRCASPLGRFEVEQMKLVAVVTGLEDPVAMVEVPGGTGYTLRRGACVGKNGGVVVAVRGDGVIIAETMIRADGSRDTAQTVLRLPKQPGFNIEEQP
jgi:type IV pilus assembly protein PilP